MQPPSGTSRRLRCAPCAGAALALLASAAACGGSVPNAATQRAEYERAMHYQRQGEDARIGQSEAAARRAPGVGWSTHARRGRLHLAAGETEQAEAELLLSLEETRYFRAGDVRSRAAVSNLERLADRYWAAPDIAGTLRITPPLIASIERVRGPRDPALPLAFRRLGEARFYDGQLTGAEADLVHSLALYRKHESRNYFQEADTAGVLGGVYEQLGKLAQAEAIYRHAAEEADSRGTEGRDLAFSLNTLAWFYAKHGRYAEAEPFARRSLEIATRLDLGRAEIAPIRDTLGTSLAGLGRNQEAEEEFQQAVVQSRGDRSIVLSYAAFLRGIGRLEDAEVLEAGVAAEAGEGAAGRETSDLATPTANGEQGA